LDLWTIYRNPRDYPNQYVARRFELDKPTADVLVAPSLARIRMLVGLEGVDACIPRAPADDPCIVEVWI